MIEPALLTLLSKTILTTGVEAVAQNLTARAFEAKKQHAELHANPELPIEKLRRRCIQRICSLQQDIVLYVSDDDFLKRVLPLTLDLVGNIYEATTKQDLEVLEMGISRVDNALTAYKNKKRERKNIRLTAVIISLLSLAAISVFLWFSKDFGITKESVITILMLPAPVLMWSIIGSFAAILYRFTNAGDSELNEPLRWLFARPLTGIIMGAIAYLILKIGLIAVQADQSVTTLGAIEITWLIAFLAGFSDRFSDFLLRNVVGKFGGKTDGDLITLEMTNQVTSTESNRFPFLNYLPGVNQKEKIENSNELANGTTNGNAPRLNERNIQPKIAKNKKSVNQSKVRLSRIKNNDSE